MAGEKHGEYILMHWDDSPPCYHAARGHLDPKTFIGLIERELADEYEPRDITEEMVNYGPQRHLYARWGWMNCYGWGWPEGEPVQTLYFFEDPGPGCFPVTVTFRTNK